MGARGPLATATEALGYLYSLTDYERMRKPRDAATSALRC